jgi:hypothetical protein
LGGQESNPRLVELHVRVSGCTSNSPMAKAFESLTWIIFSGEDDNSLFNLQPGIYWALLFSIQICGASLSESPFLKFYLNRFHQEPKSISLNSHSASVCCCFVLLHEFPKLFKTVGRHFTKSDISIERGNGGMLNSIVRVFIISEPSSLCSEVKCVKLNICVKTNYDKEVLLKGEW